MIQIENLSVSYGDEQVISNLSFTARKGDKVALSGPSGSGKSSILNLLMGFVYPYSGRVAVNGIKLNEQNIDAIRQQISWLPQELSLKIDTVEELFFYPYTFRANKHLRPSSEDVKRIFGDLLLDTSLLEKSLSEISGGQKQRVALASVLLLKKDILLLDEPTSALDGESRAAIINLVKRLEGVTVIASSHDEEWLAAMDTVINLKS
ncbi:ATP-binding cassette domain-containing protein [uncultured Acetobacteroides sp.]|uniref:ATP-binding cassette domain-containing protein n=1 Tax=uncultured Acetobacteroides sp. TaxID=1760811 RepID=UPI0029F4F112|nr:ATP-binding cassette domain-containing protein [uncultured Acetobacteroides sp.]